LHDSAEQTVPSTAQIRAEGNNTKCVGKKRFNGSVTHGLQKDKVRSYFFPMVINNFTDESSNMVSYRKYIKSQTTVILIV
jgi:hypothetical protein